MTKRLEDPDRELRERFEALRASDAAEVGPFESLRRGALRRLKRRGRIGISPRRAFLAAASATAMLLVVALVVRSRSQRPSIEEAIAQARELQSWTAPTDSLMTAADLAARGASGSASESGSAVDSQADASSSDSR
ncbi:MAG TPA: hypothetical protein VGR67_11845 [Candidatus Polarisedimenticolia bacterium]|jgi:hypothetical protein|nr:hypothetical protein [Candidatus Polarisedimenticolia bacterium]